MALPDLARHPVILDHIRHVLDRLAAQSTGSSTFIARAVVLPDEPSAAAAEVTDKGSIAQRATLANRRSLIEAMYAQPQSVGALEAASPDRPQRRAG
jgi:feruloyl-CoA synthase